MEHPRDSICFLDSAIYYYRKRRGRDSTIDTVWQKKELYNDVLVHGCLDLCARAKQKFGKVPYFIQNVILYHLTWYYRYLIDHDEKVAFLTMAERERFHALLYELFQSIDSVTIESFDLANITYFERFGWMSLYKHASMTYGIATVRRTKKGLKLIYYSNKRENIEVRLDGQRIQADFALIKHHTFVNKPFIDEYAAIIPMETWKGTLFIGMEGKENVFIYSDKNRFTGEIGIERIGTGKKRKIKQWFYNLARRLIIG